MALLLFYLHFSVCVYLAKSLARGFCEYLAGNLVHDLCVYLVTNLVEDFLFSREIHPF